ncbi:AraC family transcriptional regulator [Paenibacillus sp. F411]|uniref:helix-turn-helix domain-containing protein n=1 Tax=Paenibacillus sp. F411 TaxID=2820239 RepID=UPI001AAE2129|nr:helix-turn-helix domain-containing protein [Paenibacillus sp. F411]MBO2942649.1 AraC family transcriptional regulator [Paenibacillus sp. F411]
MVLVKMYKRYKKKHPLRRRYFSQLLFLGLISVYIPLAISMALSYWLMSSNMEEQVEQASLSELEQIRQRMDSVMTETEQATISLTLDNEVLNAVYDLDIGKDAVALLELYKKVNLIHQTIPKSFSIDLYLPRQGLLLSSKNGFLSRVDARTDVFYRSLKLSGGKAWTGVYRESQRSTAEPNLAFVRQLPVYSANDYGYLAVYYSEAELFDFIKHDARIEIWDGSNRILSHADKQMLGTIPEHEASEEILSTDRKSSGSVTDYSNSNITMYSKSSQTQWLIVKTVAVDNMFTFKSKLLWTSILVVLGSFILGICLTYYNSRKLYAPLSELLKEEQYGMLSPGMDEWGIIRHKWSNLKREIEQFNTVQAPVLREMMLSRLMNGYYANETRDETKRLCQLHHIEAQGACQVIVIDAEQYDAQDRFRKEDWQLVLFSIANIAKEVLDKQGMQAEVLSFTDLHRVIVLLRLRQEEQSNQDVQARSQAYSEEVRLAVETYMKFNVSVGIGSVCPDIYSVHKSFNDAQEALRYRLVQGGNRTISIEELPALEQESPYPLEEEQAIVLSLRNGNQEESMIGFAQFGQRLTHSGCSPTMIKHSYILLYASLCRHFNDCALQLNEMNILELLLQCTTSSEMEGLFRTRLLPLIASYVNQERERQSFHNVDKAKSYIENNIDSNLSLTAVSEHVGLNPSYFSRLFAQKTGMTFVDYVARVKVAKAKIMLLDTDWTISEIAARVGYTEPTFRRLFKQYEGSPPNAFRSRQRE